MGMTALAAFKLRVILFVSGQIPRGHSVAIVSLCDAAPSLGQLT
jgi:hypothetical protein